MSSLHEIVLDKLQVILQVEFIKYNEFLWEGRISILPDNTYYKDGKKLSAEEIKILYNKY